MKDIKDYQGKIVLVVGLGKSGINAAYLLKRLGANVTINDKKKLENEDQLAAFSKRNIKCVTGSHPLELLDDTDLIVKNPGIPYENELISAAVERNVPIITEPELAYRITESQLIGVTGTNGKTTTTTMIALMLNQNREEGKAYTCGNIGISAAKVAQEVGEKDVMVTELSSFQLMGIEKLRPHIAVLTNIYEAHTDYHGSRENYVKAKMRIVKNQKEDDYFVVNWDSEEWRNLSKLTKAKIVPFSRQDTTEEGAYVKNGVIFFRGEEIMHVDEIKVPGSHNVENALAAISVAKIEGQSNENIAEVLRTFSGVRHRTQYVTTFNGRKFYNDSKATNMEATEKALSGFENPVVLLCGGLDRGFTFERLVPYLKKHVKAMVVFGQTADLLEEAGKLAGIGRIKHAKDSSAAVSAAYEMSSEGDIVLLSPACASWDQWPTFEARGDAYIEEVEKLTREEK